VRQASVKTGGQSNLTEGHIAATPGSFDRHSPGCASMHRNTWFLEPAHMCHPPPLKWHLDQFSRFRARRYAHTQSQRQATARATCVAIGRIYAMNHRRTRRELLQLEQAAAVTTAKGRIDAAAY